MVKNAKPNAVEVKTEKQAIEKEYRDRIGAAASLVVTELRGFSTQSLNRLRRQLKVAQADYLVITNRLFRRVLEGTPYAAIASCVQGQSAVALGKSNLPDLARLLTDFEKEEGMSFVRAAVWEGAVFDANGIKRLARLPSRRELLSQVIAGVQAPLTGMVSVCSRLLTGLVVVLSEVSKKKQSSPSQQPRPEG